MECFFILGCHRSGTSCLSSLLCESPDISLNKKINTDSHIDNQNGMYEAPDVQKFHDKILKANNGSWHNPPEQVIITESQLKTMQKILKQFSGSFIKDPRSILCFENGWDKYRDNLHLVGIFREPIQVARSIKKVANDRKIQCNLQDGLDLWFKYNSRLLDVVKTYKFPLLDFNSPTFLDDMASVCGFFSIKCPDGFVNYAPSLKHQEDEKFDYDNKILVLYDELKKISHSW
nr:hypothetical protein [uncultured Desulfobulbus sp.]